MNGRRKVVYLKKDKKFHTYKKTLPSHILHFFSPIIRYYVAAMHVVDFFFSTRNDYILTMMNVLVIK